MNKSEPESNNYTAIQDLILFIVKETGQGREENRSPLSHLHSCPPLPLSSTTEGPLSTSTFNMRPSYLPLPPPPLPPLKGQLSPSTLTHLHLLQLWVHDPFTDELSHSVAFLHCQIGLGMVEEHHPDVPPVVSVYHAG